MVQAEIFAQARDCLAPMGITSENVVQRYGITREEQDQAAVCFMAIDVVCSTQGPLVPNSFLLLFLSMYC